MNDMILKAIVVSCAISYFKDKHVHIYKSISII